ncbi:epoxide hydrolase [Drepanopeziza brunnea f. sp. 'multigermtubi' MB_m1]|uniref:Epoxide hydrolase n=1 Tax=Marssonina brunnea f. sp. multigermtubi (strain MB_m1) TaxID=1072389 RepID=K1W7D7_MARBU|nr:epoxide hydrolase [Drepanopeziza brunnea f. sp. 'multigermtubi' MB_m1]EKD12985.1 epoxide hydrolase [Drepanopeziza brunnea f. sp. 'multigermtubi' MB_m1]
MVDSITPYDPRVQYKTAILNGVTYNYILAEPLGQILYTIFLIHGWPDLSFGWRYQIPHLLSLGLRVVVPDMMGYAGTDAPESLTHYTYKRAADDLAALAQQLGLSSIMLGGHDWGGAIVYRVALHYPKLIKAMFSVCTPFAPPRKEFLDVTVMPNFKYQVQLRGPEIEAEIVGKEKLRKFLTAVYGGRTPEGEPGFTVAQGLLFDALPKITPGPLVSKEEMDFYVERYALKGIRGPLNWYRTQELNFEDEKLMAAEMEGFKFDIPTLFIAGARDEALPPSMSVGMDKWFRSLTRGEVDASHWALWEKPAEVNRYIEEFLTGQISAGKASL